jgi:hypothetical protein
MTDMTEVKERRYAAQFQRTDRIYLKVYAKCGLEARQRAQKEFEKLHNKHPENLFGYNLVKVYPSAEEAGQ